MFNQVVECSSMLSRDIENILKDLNKASRNEKYNGYGFLKINAPIVWTTDSVCRRKD